MVDYSELATGERVNIRLAIFDQLLRPLRPGHMLDLATGHGLFAQHARDMGWHVTAVDARPERLPESPGIRWVVSDVRDFDVGGYDLIANLGLLYHMDVDSQVELLRRSAPTPMILDTHTGRPEITRSGFEGEDYHDPGGIRSSWGNEVSFWPTPESLARMLEEAGYRSVYGLHPPYMTGRTFHWCP